ncbi:Mobile element protein [Methanosarcina vacuolata Z-761]|uniref:Mobile element protein n=1 Tax=Methanosarcina vacuolata Z-761 TaxID=1434123 RepID=A0A0E3Q7Y8_9EURY|nr:Mobile element protein [Methanosarcina vacuolata Z-761]
MKNLKAIRKKEWHFLIRLKNNRLVNPDNKGNVPLETVDIPPKGCVVHLKACGFVKVFWIVSKDGDMQHGVQMCRRWRNKNVKTGQKRKREAGKRGRIYKDEKLKTCYRIDGIIKVNDAFVLKEMEKMGLFILVSNDIRLSPEEMLKYYKGQDKVEK